MLRSAQPHSNMSKEIVFDIETVGDIRDQASMKVTVVSVYQYETAIYRSFDEHELGDLWPVLEKAERLIGFNSAFFDVPILNRYYPGDLSRLPQLDILQVVKDSTGKRFKLNDLARATLQKEKSGHGLDAARWYEEGKIDEIKKYCEQDVLITKELYEYGRKNKMLYFPDISGALVPFAVNFDPAPAAAGRAGQGSGSINLTLPL